MDSDAIFWVDSLWHLNEVINFGAPLPKGSIPKESPMYAHTV